MPTSEVNRDILVLKNENGDFWSPVEIQEITSILKIPMIRRNNAYTTSKNIAYNLQYIQYLQKQLDSLYLTDVLNRMVCKNYVISAMSIIEAIFAYLVKANNCWKKSNWKSIQKNNIDNQSSIVLENKEIRVMTEVFEKVDEYDFEMTFDAIIDKIKSKRLMTFKSYKAFDVLRFFKGLRNKIHLHITQDATDYTIFNKTLQVQMKYILRAVLINDAICSDLEKAKLLFDFLKLTEDEKVLIGINK